MHDDTLKALINEVKSMQQEMNGRCERLIAFLEQEMRKENATAEGPNRAKNEKRGKA